MGDQRERRDEPSCVCGNLQYSDRSRLMDWEGHEPGAGRLRWRMAALRTLYLSNGTALADQHGLTPPARRQPETQYRLQPAGQWLQLSRRRSEWAELRSWAGCESLFDVGIKSGLFLRSRRPESWRCAAVLLEDPHRWDSQPGHVADEAVHGSRRHDTAIPRRGVQLYELHTIRVPEPVVGTWRTGSRQHVRPGDGNGQPSAPVAA